MICSYSDPKCNEKASLGISWAKSNDWIPYCEKHFNQRVMDSKYNKVQHYRSIDQTEFALFIIHKE